MGRIKTQLIKGVAEELVEMYRERLTSSYIDNKEFLKTRISGDSKKLKNSIIGYVSRLVKNRKEE